MATAPASGRRTMRRCTEAAVGGFIARSIGRGGRKDFLACSWFPVYIRRGDRREVPIEQLIAGRLERYPGVAMAPKIAPPYIHPSRFFASASSPLQILATGAHLRPSLAGQLTAYVHFRWPVEFSRASVCVWNTPSGLIQKKLNFSFN
jgi:hypothetical protein